MLRSIGVGPISEVIIGESYGVRYSKFAPIIQNLFRKLKAYSIRFK